jgi:hypothetical protein
MSKQQKKGAVVSEKQNDEKSVLTPFRANSFFKPFYEKGLYGSDGSAVASIPYVRAKVLAEAIPATSRATGRNPISLIFSENKNLMEFKNNFPAERKTTDFPDGRWLHSDSKDVAYIYLYKFYDDMVDKGGLK